MSIIFKKILILFIIYWMIPNNILPMEVDKDNIYLNSQIFNILRNKYYFIATITMEGLIQKNTKKIKFINFIINNNADTIYSNSKEWFFDTHRNLILEKSYNISSDNGKLIEETVDSNVYINSYVDDVITKIIQKKNNFGWFNGVFRREDSIIFEFDYIPTELMKNKLNYIKMDSQEYEFRYNNDTLVEIIYGSTFGIINRYDSYDYNQEKNSLKSNSKTSYLFGLIDVVNFSEDYYEFNENYKLIKSIDSCWHCWLPKVVYYHYLNNYLVSIKKYKYESGEVEENLSLDGQYIIYYNENNYPVKIVKKDYDNREEYIKIEYEEYDK